MGFFCLLRDSLICDYVTLLFKEYVVCLCPGGNGDVACIFLFRSQAQDISLESAAECNQHIKVRWLNGRASDYESGGSRFDPWVDRFLAFVPSSLLCSVTRIGTYHILLPFLSSLHSDVLVSKQRSILENIG